MRRSSSQDAMSERRVTNLIRLALEAEEFDADVRRPLTTGLKLSECGPEERAALLETVARAEARSAMRSSGMRWMKSALAMAACLGLGWVTAELMWTRGPVTGAPPLASSSRERTQPKLQGTGPTGGTSLATGKSMPWFPARSRDSVAVSSGGAGVEDMSASTGASGCVVVAIFKDSRGGCRCVHIQPHAWEDGRALADRGPGDLLGVKLSGTCSTPSDALLLVAVEGPRELLPQTSAEAEALAECVSMAPKECDGSPGCYASVASRCLPSKVSVLAQTVQMSSR